MTTATVCRLEFRGFTLELPMGEAPALRIYSPEGEDVTLALFNETNPVPVSGGNVRRAFMLIDHEMAVRAVHA